MKLFLSFTLFSIFLILAILHFYWATGRTWGFEKALPTNENGVKLFTPRTIDSIVVGFALLAFSLFYLLQSGIIQHSFPTGIFKYGGWIIPIIFIFRAVGEFKYVGFFKSIRQTEFGQLDTFFYSPLCLFIGIAGLLIIANK